MSEKKDDVIVAEPVDEPRQRALPPPDDASKSGEYIPAGEGHGTINDPHTTGIAAELAGRGRVSDVNLSEIDTEWVLRRLVKEATDFGTRTRQTGRIKALELIGEHLGMWGELPEDENAKDHQRVRDMPRAERLKRIAELSRVVGVPVPGEKTH